MGLLSFIHSHAWTPWNTYVQEYEVSFHSGVAQETRQHRRCTTCGKTEDRFVCKGVSASVKKEGQ